MEQSAIRVFRWLSTIFPDFAPLHPGYTGLSQHLKKNTKDTKLPVAAVALFSFSVRST